MKGENLSAAELRILNERFVLGNDTLIVSSADDSYGVGEILCIETKDVKRVHKDSDGVLYVEFIDTERDNELANVPIYDFIVLQKH